MAEEKKTSTDAAPVSAPHKCPECPPGLPGWMATFSDLVTLLLTFFVLLLSFAKTESAKYEAALGSIRNAFGGNVFKIGEVIQRGKSPENSPTQIESELPSKPFPIEFLTTDGLLDKHEINRESTETLEVMRDELEDFDLTDNVNIYEINEGVKVVVKDIITFERGSSRIRNISIPIFEKIIKLMKEKNWIILIQGHSSVKEVGRNKFNQTLDSYELSSLRATAVTKNLLKRGVKASRVITLFYGDSRPIDDKNNELNQRVDFILRKQDLRSGGYKVPPR